MHQRSSRLAGLSAVVLIAIVHTAAAADFYVSPSATASGNGSIGSPWRLQTALNHPSAVHPGDTIWLRGGTYVGYFASNLNGTSAAPIIVRQYPGERATIDGNYGGDEITFSFNGSYTWFWGFEITNSNPNRVSTSSSIPPANRGQGSVLSGDGVRVINMVIHDTDQGIMNTGVATDSRIYGNLIYYNGWEGSDRGHGHGVYAQNQDSVLRQIHDNIIFQQMGFGIHAYTEQGSIDNLEFIGNTAFNNGGISSYGWTTNILVGGLQVADNPKLIDNYTYNSDHGGMNNLGYSAGCTSPTLTGNYFDGATALKIKNCSGVSMTGNTFYGGLNGFTQSQYPNNTYYSSQPTGKKIFIRPNAYEAGRAHITIYNWDQSSTVPVDLSGLLSPGAYYEVRNAQNPFGPIVIAGTYSGGSVTFPMTGMTPATPVGLPTPVASGPKFNVFVLTSTIGPNEFYDVPASSPFHAAIQSVAAAGITAGCGNGYFCPNATISRAQMSVFLLKSKHGAAYTPPAATGTLFTDVPASAFAADWIERLAAEGITTGCGGNKFCPNSGVSRAQMAVFLLKASLGSGYAPPAATGTVFSDVPASAFAAAWIEDLAGRGITAGCGNGKYCPNSINTRAQMAVFLVGAFSLQ